MSSDRANHDNKQHAAVCGLYCPGCTLNIASTEEPERLARTAGRFNVTLEEAPCYGCRSEVISIYSQACEIKKCADENGL